MSFIRNTDTLVEGLQNKWFTNARAKSAVQGDLDQLAADISSEASARQSAVSDLQGQINNVLSNVDPEALDSLTEIVAAFQAADSDLNSAISSLAGSAGSNLAAEEAARIAADEVLQSNIDAEQAARIAADEVLQSNIDAEQAARIAADEVLQSNIDAEQAARITADESLGLRLDIVEERDGYLRGSFYNDSPAVFADGRPGTEDPSSLTRDGWYYENTVAGQKINWYFFDGTNAAAGAVISLANFSAYAIVSFDSLQGYPIFGVYTMPTGINDVIPGFAHSKIAYSANLTGKVIGKKYLVYFGQNPSVNPELERIQLVKSASSSAGEQLPTEIVLTVSYGSNSGNAVNSVKMMVESLGVYSPNYKTQIALKVRSATKANLDSEISSRISADSALGARLDILEADPTTKTYVDGQIAATVASAENQIDAEQSRATSAESALSARLDTLEADPVTKAYVDGEISAEEAARIAADSALSGRLDVLEADPTTKAYVDGIDSALDARLDVLEADPVTKAYVDGEVSDLQGQINNVLSNVDPEALDSLTEIVAAFQAADSDLNSAISSLAGSAGSNLAAEEAARIAADSALSGRLDVLEADPVTKAYVDSGLNEKVDVTVNYDIKPSIYPGGNKSSNFEINWANGPVQEFTLGASVVVTFANPVAGGTYLLKLIQDGTGARQITWPVNVEFSNGESPVLSGANKTDFVQLFYDGTKYYADSQLEDVTFATSSELSAEEAARIAADSALSGRLDVLEADPTTKAYVDGIDSALDARLDVLEADPVTKAYVDGEDLTMFKLDGSRQITGNVLFSNETQNIGSLSANRPNRIFVKDKLQIGGSEDQLSANPGSMAFVASGTANNNTFRGVYFANNADSCTMDLRKSRGTETSPLPVTSGNRLGRVSFRGNDGTTLGGTFSNSSYFQAVAEETFSSTARGSRLEFYTTASGTTTISERLRIQSGSIVINEPGLNYDLRVEGDTDENLLFVHGGLDRIGIGMAVPSAKLDINGDLRLSAASAANLTWGTDGAGNIGSSGANRPNNVYVKTNIEFGGGLKVGFVEKSANYSVENTDYVIGVTSATGGKMITLPSASGNSGRVFVIKDQSGSASATDYIRIMTQSGETIEGQSSYDIDVPYESVTVYSNGTDWFIV
jgi:hypothetical protein